MIKIFPASAISLEIILHPIQPALFAVDDNWFLFSMADN
jgi:hypothetical protein